MRIPGVIVLPLALALGAFGARSVGRPPDINQSSSKTVCAGTNGVAIALLLAGTVFLI